MCVCVRARAALFPLSHNSPYKTEWSSWSRCSPQQIAIIKRCASHCGACSDDVETAGILGDCIVVHPFGNALIGGSAMLFENCHHAAAASAAPLHPLSMHPLQREIVTADVWAGPAGAYSYHFGASSFGKPVTLTLNFISADTFTMRVEAPISSMSAFCRAESYSYTDAAGLRVAGYEVRARACACVCVCVRVCACVLHFSLVRPVPHIH